MNKEYGYARISTPKQNIDRQVRNILVSHPQAHIVKEVYTGTKFQGRKELDKLLNKATAGDTIIFDSVSRMSRNAEEGFVMYEKLFNQGISLVFLKEPHINTDTYKKALQGGIPTTGTNVDFILDGINKYLLALAKEQIDQEHTTGLARKHTVLLIRCFYSTPENMLHLNSGQIWAVTSVKVRNQSL